MTFTPFQSSKAPHHPLYSRTPSCDRSHCTNTVMPEHGTLPGVKGANDTAGLAQEHPLSSTDAGLYPTESNGRFQQVCADLDSKVTAFLNADHEDTALRGIQNQTRISIGVIEEALNRYEFDELSLSYNGGKDCLVLLILYLVGIHRHFAASQKPFPTRLKSVYIKPGDPFPQVTEFVESSSRYYHLDLLESNLPMREAFTEYLQRHPEVRTILVGTRRTDPHGGKLTHFDMTDGAWPRFMRCHPVIDWHYRDIWSFIRYFEIPYCSLYDLGYTSLGGTTDTHPNPALKAADADYRPAYELTQDDEERLGRDGK